MLKIVLLSALLSSCCTRPVDQNIDGLVPAVKEMVNPI